MSRRILTTSYPILSPSTFSYLFGNYIYLTYTFILLNDNLGQETICIGKKKVIGSEEIENVRLHFVNAHYPTHLLKNMSPFNILNLANRKDSEALENNNPDKEW